MKGGSEVAMEKESSGAEGEKEQVSAPAFELLGLLYASSPNIKHNRYTAEIHCFNRYYTYNCLVNAIVLE